MTLQELFNQGVHFQSNTVVQYWENDNNPTVLFEGYDPCLSDVENKEWSSWNVSYIFADNNHRDGICLFIELDNER